MDEGTPEAPFDRQFSISKLNPDIRTADSKDVLDRLICSFGVNRGVFPAGAGLFTC
jgi:hypothetical protein